MSFVHLLWKDLKREIRGREALGHGLLLAGTFFLLFLFAFRRLDTEPEAAATVLWVPLVFAGAAMVGRGLASEADQGTLDLLRRVPVPLVWHGLSRTAIDLVLGSLVGTLTLALGWLLFGVPVSPAVMAVFAVSIPGIVLAGSLAGGIAAQTRARELLLPLLMMPVLAPLLLTGVHATLVALDGTPITDLRSDLTMITAYDIILLGAAWLLWPFVLEGD